MHLFLVTTPGIRHRPDRSPTSNLVPTSDHRRRPILSNLQHSRIRVDPDPIPPSQDTQQLRSFLCNLVIVLFDPPTLDVQEIFLGDLLRRTTQQGTEVRFAFLFSREVEREGRDGFLTLFVEFFLFDRGVLSFGSDLTRRVGSFLGECSTDRVVSIFQNLLSGALFSKVRERLSQERMTHVDTSFGTQFPPVCHDDEPQIVLDRESEQVIRFFLAPSINCKKR